MKKITTLLFIVSALLCACPAAFAESKILHLSSGKTISFPEMMTEVRKADFIFLGDDITVTEHQYARMGILEELYKHNRNLALGVEMFRSGNQYILDQWSAGEIPKKRFMDAFDQSWGKWDRYCKLFDYIRDKKIKMTGLNISRDILIQVQMKGFDSLTSDQLGDLGGITCDISPDYKEVVRRVTLYKGMLQVQTFKNYCEMKILGDIVMARNLEKFHQQHPELTTIVLAGNGHAWKHGIPNRMNNKDGTKSVTVLFEAEGRMTRDNITPGEADYLWLDYGIAGWKPVK